MGIQILKTSSYLPPNIVYNDFFEKYLDTSDTWIKSRTGIESRNFIKDENILDMVKAAIDNLNIDIEEIKKIKKVIVATCTYRDMIPSLSSQVQGYLNLEEDIFSVDINMACSGYVAGLSLLDNILKEDEYAILIGAEVFSKLLDFNDRNTAILFGDGVGASLISKNNENSIFSSGCISNGKVLNISYDNLYMEGREVYRFAVSTVSKKIKEFLITNNIDIEKIDYLISHQANIRILESIGKDLKLPKEKILSNLKNIGNISAASIPVLLDEYNRKNLFKKGDRLLFLGFGAGLNWSIGYIKW